MHKKFTVILALVSFFIVLNVAVILPVKAAGLEITYNSKGLGTLKYNGVTLVNTNANPGDGFLIGDYKYITAGGGSEMRWGGVGNTQVMDLANQELTWSYSWGSVRCKYVQMGDRLNLVFTVANNTAQDTIGGVSIFPLALRFPGVPVGFDLTSPQISFGNQGPVVVANYGSGLVAIANDDQSKHLYTGLNTTPETATLKRYPLWISSVALQQQPSFWPKFENPVPPKTSRTYTVSLRFAPATVDPVALTTDVYQSYAAAWPLQVNWPDRRSIGALFLAGWPITFPKNPRGWFGDSTIDITTPAGLADFHRKLLKYADDSIVILKDMNAQGMVTWDIEGDMYPHNTTYLCDPTQLAKVAPEMEPIADAYFKKFRDAGLKVGVCVRPQNLIVSADASTAQQVEAADPAQVMIDKIRYAKQRWGATMFYVDSNGGPYDPYDAISIFKKVADAHPDVLLIPEHQNFAYHAYTAPYNQLANSTFDYHSTPATVRAAYPSAFTVLYAVDGPIDAERAELVQGVRSGDILMFRGWWNDPYNAKIKSIYQEAGMFTPPAGGTPPGSGTGLKGEYFGTEYFTNLKVTRTDQTVNFEWGRNAPASSMEPDNFSAQWSGQVEPRYSETYTFYTTSDDGVRLWVNGQLLINNWTYHAPTENSATISLAAGQRYDIRMEFFEGSYDATAKLLWSSQSQAKEIIPRGQLYSASASGTGLRGEYYDNDNFTVLKVTRTDPTVNFDWGSGSPESSIGPETFSVRWTGQIAPLSSGIYTFHSISDDGVRLWVNGQLIIDQWNVHAPTEHHSQSITLAAGQRYDIRMEFFENSGGAVAKLFWSSGSQTKEVVPQQYLYPAASTP